VPSPADRPLRVLFTNRVLAHRTGTEVYVRDVALGLLRRGHRPVVYTPRPGALAAEIRAQTIPVVDDPAAIGEPPDIIHGHHGLETLTALLAFPGVPAVNVCHGWSGWADAPLVFPRVLRHIAVDDTCRHRLVAEHGIAPERVSVVLNAVDLARFQPRSPLPSRPRRALLFSNSSGSHAPHAAAIRRVCERQAIALDVAGAKAGTVLLRPEKTLREYDVVFAKARAALEASAVGAAVVLCDVAGAGPLVTTDNLDDLRRLNFGIRALREAPTDEWFAGELARYDPADAAAVSQRLRATAGHDRLEDQLLEIYDEVLREHAQGVDDPAREQRAAAAYMRQLGPRLHQGELLEMAFAQLLRFPFARYLFRRRVAREHPDHWFGELLRSMDKE
jgi:hypothetical protein